jgi:hypothetical protein
MSTIRNNTLAFSVLALSLVACGKANETSGAPGATGAARSAVSPSGASSITTGTPAAAAGGKGAVLAQCMKKSAFKCSETYGFVAELAPDFCKGLEGNGVFSRGDKPCPKGDLIATCEFNGETQSEISYHYRDTSVPLAEDVAGAKTACGIIDGKFTETPRSADVKAPAKAVAKKK